MSWIDAKEKMPADGEFFLGYGPGLGEHTHGPTMEICLWDGTLWTEGGTEVADRHMRFTHWQPLPLPPA